MEARFGYDFAHVRVHDGREAAESASKIGARAYTVDSHIVFGDGEYAPTHRGRWLLAHELAHIVQQDAGQTSGLVQRREVDDRSCAGLTDIESEVDNHVNNEIGAARTAGGTPLSVSAFLKDVYKRLGEGIISPIEDFIETLPASKRNRPPGDLAGTKYSGVGGVYQLLATAGEGNRAVASAAKIHGICAGADKLGHFFDLGYKYWQADSLLPGQFTTAVAEALGRATEIEQYGLAISGVFSNADQEANLAGWQFYNQLAAAPGSFTFRIADFITPKWNEQVNPSFYTPDIGAGVWANLLRGVWQGTIAVGTSTPDTIKMDLTATTTAVTGTYETPAGATAPANKGKITGGTITQNTTTVSGQIPGDPAVSATTVTGITILYDWARGTRSGKGRLDSVDEQTLHGTWGTGSLSTNGGTLSLKKL